jgi:hypothetical protein
MDNNEGIERDASRGLFGADEGWPELPIRRRGRTDWAEPQIARYVRLTFPEPGKIILRVGPGDHTEQLFQISRESLRGIVLDAIPFLTDRS